MITQRQLEMLFDSPGDLYRLLAERPGYVPAMPGARGDSELLCTGVICNGAALFVCMRHQERLAHIMLLDSQALYALKEAIESLHASVNLQELNSSIMSPFTRR